MKARRFQITLNQVEYHDTVVKYLKGLKSLSYILGGLEEAPTTGHKHIHYYVEFNQSIKLSAKGICNAHLEKCYGDAEANIKYIKKPETKILIEAGKPKLKLTIANVKKMKKEEREQLPIQMYNIVNKINEEEENVLTVETTRKKVKVWYISGKTGIGKTELALNLIGKEKYCSVKYENGFWMGLADTEWCLYDDWRDYHMKPNEFINFIDYNKHIMNVKNGRRMNNFKFIIITNIFKLEKIYKNIKEEQRGQWVRRVRNIDLDDWLDNLPIFFNCLLLYFFKLFKYKLYL